MKKIYSLFIMGLGCLLMSITPAPIQEKNNSNNSLSAGHNKTTISFQKLTFADALQQAKKENKKVFINVYATWCGPCKMMQVKTYTDPKVVNYFNSHFININLDVEHNPEGMKIARRYGVRAHPCLLFINPDGSLSGKIVGYYQGASLIAMVKQNVK